MASWMAWVQRQKGLNKVEGSASACKKVYIVLSTVFYRVQCALFYIENDAQIFPAHYTWKVAEYGYTMAFMMNKVAMNNSCEIILEL